MASLTETAIVARKMIKFGAIGFVGITIMWFVGGAAIRYYQELNPPPAPPPTMDFGKLPAIEFPKETARPKLSLELPTGVIPKFPDRMRVFYAPTKRSGFLDPDRAIETARALGFVFKPDQPSETKYVWTNQDNLTSRLEMDIVSGHFMLTRNWQNNPAILSQSNFTSDQQVINDVINYLRKTNLMAEDIGSEQKVTYLKAETGKLSQTISLSEADFVQVDMFRNNFQQIDKETKKILSDYSYYRPDPDQGLIRAIVSGSKDQNEKIISMQYDYTKVDYNSVGTYPIKTGEQAWQEFSEGKGYVTPKGAKMSSAVVRRILLGYYDAASQKYSMPVYIFLGDAGFTGYVSAIDDAVIK